MAGVAGLLKFDTLLTHRETVERRFVYNWGLCNSFRRCLLPSDSMRSLIICTLYDRFIDIHKLVGNATVFLDLGLAARFRLIQRLDCAQKLSLRMEFLLSSKSNVHFLLLPLVKVVLNLAP